jgi:hypothetical protein
MNIKPIWAFGLAALLVASVPSPAQSQQHFIIATGAEPDSFDITAGFFSHQLCHLAQHRRSAQGLQR